MSRKGFLLLLLFTFQLAVPISMIIQKEGVLNRGDLVKFQVRPIDPYDAFRGRYLNIGLREERVSTKGETFREDQTVYVLIITDEEGFAQLTDVSAAPYDQGLYMKCTVDEVEENYLIIRPPFNRYYLNEEYAPMADELFRDNAYITVRLRKGRAVIEEMYLEGVEINSLIEERLKN